MAWSRIDLAIVVSDHLCTSRPSGLCLVSRGCNERGFTSSELTSGPARVGIRLSSIRLSFVRRWLPARVGQTNG